MCTQDSAVHMNTNAKYQPQGVSVKCAIVFEGTQKAEAAELLPATNGSLGLKENLIYMLWFPVIA